MHTTSLRKVGGSVMLAVPPVFLDQLRLQAGAAVALTIDRGQLVINPSPKPQYTMAQLLAASDYSQAQPSAEREWIDTKPVGDELL